MIRRADGVEIRLASFVAGENPQVTVTKQYMDLSTYVTKNDSSNHVLRVCRRNSFLVVLTITKTMDGWKSTLGSPKTIHNSTIQCFVCTSAPTDTATGQTGLTLAHST